MIEYNKISYIFLYPLVAGMTDEEYWATFKGEKGERERQRFESMLLWMGNEVATNKEYSVDIKSKSPVEVQPYTSTPTDPIKQILSPPKAGKILKSAALKQMKDTSEEDEPVRTVPRHKSKENKTTLYAMRRAQVEDHLFIAE